MSLIQVFFIMYLLLENIKNEPVETRHYVMKRNNEIKLMRQRLEIYLSTYIYLK